jgi:four helix bundle protein
MVLSFILLLYFDQLETANLRIMAKIERFEDLRCWQMSRKLVKDVYGMSTEGALGRDFGTRDQIRRAALSVMNNVAEGFARFSKKEFILFLNYAQSSAAEVKSILYVCEDLTYLPKPQSSQLHAELDDIRKSILALIKYLHVSRQNYSGSYGSRVREPRQEYRRSPESYDLPEEHLHLPN